MTLCERCLHAEICATRDGHDEWDERALTYCRDFIGWISVDERLPEGKAPILVTDGEKVIMAYRNWLYRSNGTGKLRCPANYGNGMYVTHWMPLPEAPKMKGGAV